MMRRARYRSTPPGPLGPRFVAPDPARQHFRAPSSLASLRTLTLTSLAPRAPFGLVSVARPIRSPHACLTRARAITLASFAPRAPLGLSSLLDPAPLGPLGLAPPVLPVTVRPRPARHDAPGPVPLHARPARWDPGSSHPTRPASTFMPLQVWPHSAPSLSLHSRLVRTSALWHTLPLDYTGRRREVLAFKVSLRGAPTTSGWERGRPDLPPTLSGGAATQPRLGSGPRLRGLSDSISGRGR